MASSSPHAHADSKATFLADRFLTVDGVSTDVALDQRVWLEHTGFEGAAARTSWLERAATLQMLRHPALVSVVDYGLVDGVNGFVAFACDGSRACQHPRPHELKRVLTAVEFLHRMNLSAGIPGRDRLVMRRGNLALLPDRPTGTPCDRAQSFRERKAWQRSARCPLSTYGGPVARCASGVSLQRPDVLSAISDWLDEEGVVGLRTLHLSGAPGAGVTTMVELVAREARVRGYVTLSLDWAIDWVSQRGAPECLDRWIAGRHLLLLGDHRRCRDRPGSAERLQRQACLLARLATLHRRPVLVLMATLSPPRAGAFLELGGIPKTVLRAAVAAGGTRRERLVDEAFRASGGLIGRFIEFMQGPQSCGPSPRLARRSAATAVAETSARYASSTPCALTLTAELEARRRAGERGILRLDEAVALVRRGRHARAERVLRELRATQMRRGDHLGAGCAGALLGRLLTTRGRCADAAETFQKAQVEFERTSSPGGMALAAAHVGAIRTSQARFDEAERLLRGIVVALDSTDEKECRAFAVLMLVRCCFWSGRFDEARQLISRLPDGSDPGAGPWVFWPPLGAARRAVLARLALAERSLHTAIAEARMSFDEARQVNDDAALLQAIVTSAEVHGHLGNVDQLNEAWRHGRDAVRRVREPLKGLELRLAVLNGFVIANRVAEARGMIKALKRLELARLPELLAARIRFVLKRVLSTDHARTDRVCETEQSIRETGATGLRALYGSPRSDLSSERERPWLRHVIDVLTMCRDSEDERETLGQVSGLVRERTRASSVAFFAVRPDGLAMVSSAGARTDHGVTARRAVESGLAIAPGRQPQGIEAAVPIRYGASTVGVLACRWIAAEPGSEIEEFLQATAVACAPCLRTVVDRLRPPPDAKERTPEILGISPSIEDVRRVVLKAAAAPFAVLIEGESGTGKELVARAIHRLGSRHEGKWATVNCAALVDDLIEAELFGHARGAFTGAVTERRGMFEECHGGTLFLDEVSELSARAQAKLLRVIQEGEVRRVGETFARHVDVRLISASNRPLEAQVAAGRFRADLMYRLDVIRISVPPLRARVEDIPGLVRHFWEECCRRLGRRAVLRASLVATLTRYEWPGNVRELQNVMAALAVAAPERGTVGPAALPRALARAASADGGDMTLQEARRRFEERLVRTALARAGGRRARAAADLGISRQGLAKLMDRLGLSE